MSLQVRRIAWAITGAGHYLKESIDMIRRLVSEYDVSVTAYVSRAGRSVLKMYRLDSELEQILTGRRGCEVVYEDEEPPSFPRAGRVYLGRYAIVVVSPTTFNTLAKIASGIADTLVTNLVSHALKARVPVALVVPDLECPLESTVPLAILVDECEKCDQVCKAAEACPRDALYVGPDKLPHIDYSKCDYCGACVSACPRGAIRKNYRVTVYPHPLLANIVERVRSIGIAVFPNLEQLWNSLLYRLVQSLPR